MANPPRMANKCHPVTDAPRPDPAALELSPHVDDDVDVADPGARQARIGVMLNYPSPPAFITVRAPWSYLPLASWLEFHAVDADLTGTFGPQTDLDMIRLPEVVARFEGEGTPARKQVLARPGG